MKDDALMTRESVVERLSFALSRLSARNGYMAFEDLCRAYAREVLAPNLLPATGPVGAGGDRGRDFETFRSYGSDGYPEGAFWCPQAAAGVVFACSTQQRGVEQKVRDDVDKITAGGTPVAEVCCFLTAPLAIGRRAKLVEELEGSYGVGLQIFDREALAEALASPKLLWIAEEHLPVEGLRESAYGPFPMALGAASEIDPTVGWGVGQDVLSARGSEPLRVRRDAEEELREVLEHALSRPGPSLVVVEGGPQAGKTHTAIAALARAAPSLPVHRARSPAELRAWLATERDEPAGLLLDPVDPVADDPGLATDFSARNRGPSLPILAVGSFRDVEAFEMPANALRVEVDTALSPHELERTRETLLGAGLLEDVERWGLGPAMVAGPRLTLAYRRARKLGGREGDGSRLVETMLGWRAAGMRQPLAEATLRRIWEGLYPEACSERAWQQGLDWIAEEAAPGQSPARLGEGGWSPHPALRELGPPRGWREAWLSVAVWDALGTWAGEESGRMASLGTAAWRLGDAGRARATLEQAIAAGSLRARFNLARTYATGEDPRPDVARDLLLSLRDELGGEPELLDPGRRQLLALTWQALGVLDHDAAPSRAAASYQEAIALGNLDAMANLAQLERGAGERQAAECRLRHAAGLGSAHAAAALVVGFGAEVEEVLDEIDAASAGTLGRLLLERDRKADAQRAFARAAAAGRLSATAQLGGLLLDAGDPAAIEVLEPAAERGSRAAMQYLARALRTSRPSRARRLLRTAHELGSPTAGAELMTLLREDGSEEAVAEKRLLREELDAQAGPP